MFPCSPAVGLVSEAGPAHRSSVAPVHSGLHALYVRQLCRLPTSQHDSAHGSPPSRPQWLTVHVVEPTWGYFSHTYQRTYEDGCAGLCVCSDSCGGRMKRRGAPPLFPHLRSALSVTTDGRWDSRFCCTGRIL